MNRRYLHFTAVRWNNSNRARLSWTFSYIYCIFVHPDLDSAPLFVGMRESSNGYLFQMEHGYNDIENQKFISSSFLDKPTLFNKKVLLFSQTFKPNLKFLTDTTSYSTFCDRIKNRIGGQPKHQTGSISRTSYKN